MILPERHSQKSCLHNGKVVRTALSDSFRIIYRHSVKTATEKKLIHELQKFSFML